MTSLGGNLSYNLQGGFVKQVVNTSNYWAYPYNRFLVNNGDGQSIGVKQGVGTLHAKIEAFATIASSISREIYLGIAIDASNENISAEAYVTTTYDVPISNIYVCNPFIELHGGEKIRLFVYSNNPICYGGSTNGNNTVNVLIRSILSPFNSSNVTGFKIETTNSQYFSINNFNFRITDRFGKVM